MKTSFTLCWLILAPAFAVFAQNSSPLGTGILVPDTKLAPQVQVKNDTLSFAFLMDKNGKPIMDSSDCFIIGDLQAAKLLVFPVTSSSADMMDDFLFMENTKAKQNVSYYKCILPKGVSGGAQYAAIQKTLEAKLRIKFKMPNLRIRLVWAPGLSDEDTEVNFVR